MFEIHHFMLTLLLKFLYSNYIYMCTYMYIYLLMLYNNSYIFPFLVSLNFIVRLSFTHIFKLIDSFLILIKYTAKNIKGIHFSLLFYFFFSLLLPFPFYSVLHFPFLLILCICPYFYLFY